MSSEVPPSPGPSPAGPPVGESDRADMVRLVAGHDAALNDLMERHAPSVFRFLCRMLASEDDADDLTQETFVRVYQNRTSFRADACFSTWLFTIAANLARNHLRWRERHPNVALEAKPDEDTPSLRDTLSDGRLSAPEAMEAAERVDAIRSAVAELPEELRTPLVLAEYEDQSQKEIAQILSCSVKAVETRIYRARQQLRTSLRRFLGKT